MTKGSSGPCTGEVPLEAYAALVGRLEAALDGDPEPLLAPLRRRTAGYAAEQRFEQAAARDRLEGLSRALDDRRRLATISAVGELVLARPHPRGREVTVLRHGQLVRSRSCRQTTPSSLRPTSLSMTLNRSPVPRRAIWLTSCGWWPDGSTRSRARWRQLRSAARSPARQSVALPSRYAMTLEGNAGWFPARREVGRCLGLGRFPDRASTQPGRLTAET